MEGKNIAKVYNIEKRTECIANMPAFISLKDHKDNFQQKLPCRLINPCKTELGRVSKNILDKINTNIRNSLNPNQWKNTDDVTTWFNQIKNKQNSRFIQTGLPEQE